MQSQVLVMSKISKTIFYIINQVFLQHGFANLFLWLFLDTNMERESGRKAQLSNITAAKVKKKQKMMIYY